MAKSSGSSRGSKSGSGSGSASASGNTFTSSSGSGSGSAVYANGGNSNGSSGTTSQNFTKNPIEEYKLQEKITNEEYKMWKKTVPLLYETVQAFVLDQPSTIFKWISTPEGIEISEDKNSLKAKFLLSRKRSISTSSTGSNTQGAGSSGSGFTHSSSNSDYGSFETILQVATVELPSTLSPLTDNTIPIPSGPAENSKFQIIKEYTISNSGDEEVTKLSFNGKNQKIAAFLSSGDIAIFDFIATNNTNASNNQKGIFTRLKFHEKPGKALEWSPIFENQLLSGSEDGKIAFWDLSLSSTNNESSAIITPQKIIDTQAGAVNDVSWNSAYPSIVASVTSDISLQIFDLDKQRHQQLVEAEHSPIIITTPIYHIKNAHSDQINTVAFHPLTTSGTLLATGSSDHLVSLWDLRYFERPFRNLYGIMGPVTQLQFDKTQANILSSASEDKRVYIWDLNEIDAGDFDDEIYSKDPDNEDPCLKFIHGGHIAKVLDYDISYSLFNVYGSVASDGSVEVWKPYFEEEEEEEEEDDEEEEDEEKDVEMADAAVEDEAGRNKKEENKEETKNETKNEKDEKVKYEGQQKAEAANEEDPVPNHTSAITTDESNATKSEENGKESEGSDKTKDETNGKVNEKTNDRGTEA